MRVASLAGALAVGSGATAQEIEPVDAFIDAGEAAAAAGDWAAARTAFEQAIAIQESPAGWYQLAVARALSGDAVGAAAAFRRVQEIDPGFPEIDERVAHADARVAYEAEQAVDRVGFDSEPAVRLEAREDALQRDDLVYASRAAVGLEPGAGPVADAMELRAHGAVGDAAVMAVHAVGQDPTNTALYLQAADALRLAGDPATARYYLGLFVDRGGDPVLAAPVRRAIDAIDAPGR